MITHLACAADTTLRLVTKGFASTGSLQCSFCLGQIAAKAESTTGSDSLESIASESLAKIVRLDAFRESRRPRIIAVIGLRRMIRHCRKAELWDLEKSVLGQWCLQCLHSSQRELRIAAGRSLLEFFKGSEAIGFDEDIARRNRVNTLAILKSLSDKDTPQLTETCIMAWAQLGQKVTDEELNLVLIQLTEYLGHTNLAVSGLAFSEMLNLATARGTTPSALFRPFWKNLAFSIVKDMVARPQLTRMMAELHQISVPDLLLLLQGDALPWLVLTKKKDVIQKIAEVRGEERAWQACLDHGNLTRILAILLTQDVPSSEGDTRPRVEDYAMSLLRHISSHFEEFTMVDLLRTEPMYVIYELFKLSGEGDEGRKQRVCTAGMSLGAWYYALTHTYPHTS